jgi:hypothetical protein
LAIFPQPVRPTFGQYPSITRETAEFLGGDDDHFIAALDGDALRAVATDTPYQLAEAGLGVLQQPPARLENLGRLRRSWGILSGHTD